MSFSESIVARFEGDTSHLDRAVRAIPGKIADAGKKVTSSVSGWFAGIASVAGLVTAFDKVSAFADKIRGTAEALDVGTDFLQGFFGAARNNSADNETAQKGLEKLAANLGKAQKEGGEAAQMFEKYGIAIRNADGTTRDVEEVTRAVADRLAETSNGAERAAIAVELLGKAGIKLIPAMQGGSAALDAFIDSASKLSRDDIERIDDMKDSLGELGNSALLSGARVFAGIKRAFDGVERSKFTPERMKAIAGALFQAITPGGQLSGLGMLGDALNEVGADNGGKGLSADEALAKRAAKQQELYDIRKTEQKNLFEQAKKFQDEITKLTEQDRRESMSNEDRLAEDLGKRDELHAEMANLVEGTLPWLAKEAELRRLNLDITKEQRQLGEKIGRDQEKRAEDEKRRTEEQKRAKEDLDKATASFEQAQHERRTFSLAQLAGEGDAFDPAAGVRGASRRRAARRSFYNSLTPDELYTRATAQGVQDAESNADRLARAGAYLKAQDELARADRLRASLPAEFASLADRDPLNALKAQLEDLNKKLDGVLKVEVKNAAQ